MNNQAAALAAWLRGLEGIHAVVPVKATFGRFKGLPEETYIGATYKRHMTPPAGACNMQPYIDECLYILGQTPECRIKAGYTRTNESKAVFNIPGDSRDWYVGSEYTIDGRKRAGIGRASAETESRYHPFGDSLILFPWKVAQPIDYYDTTRRFRVPLTLENI